MIDINTIGIAIITCDREEFFKRCLSSIPFTDRLIIINDGQPYPLQTYPEGVPVLQHTRNMGVAASKNEALRKLIDRGCEHLFLIEDDIRLLRADVFETYIKTAAASGIWHLNYALHGSYNRDSSSAPQVKNIIEYKPGISVAFYQNILGAFSYYLKGVIKNVGYMDEGFRNAFEHVDHTYRIIKKGLHPAFWWFADIAESWNYIEDQTENYAGSKIRNEKEFAANFQRAMSLFQYKHGTIPQNVPQISEAEVLKQLEEIQHDYAKEL